MRELRPRRMTATDRKAFRSVLEARERAEKRRERDMREYSLMLSTKMNLSFMGFSSAAWVDEERFKDLDAKFGVSP